MGTIANRIAGIAHSEHMSMEGERNEDTMEDEEVEIITADETTQEYDIGDAPPGSCLQFCIEMAEFWLMFPYFCSRRGRR